MSVRFINGTCGYTNDLQWSLPGTLRVSQLSGCGDLTTETAPGNPSETLGWELEICWISMWRDDQHHIIYIYIDQPFRKSVFEDMI